MPHRTIIELPNPASTMLQKWHSEAWSASAFYGAIVPLYLDDSWINLPSLGTEMDPIKPYFGHWSADTGIYDDQGVLHPAPGQGLPGWTNETENRFMRPSPKWFLPQHPTNAKTFRTLAKKKIRTASTEATKEWHIFKAHFLEGEGAIPTDDYVAQYKQALLAAAASGYLPHYHEGYIDGNNNGFTTGVFVDPHWLPIKKFLKAGAGMTNTEYAGATAAILSAVTTEIMEKSIPFHHTHLIGTYKQGTINPDLDDPATFKLNGWLWDPYHHSLSFSNPGYDETLQLQGGHPTQPMGLHGITGGLHRGGLHGVLELGDPALDQIPSPVVIGEFGITVPDEIIFLEAMDVFYSNEAANQVIAAAGLETTVRKTLDPHATGDVPVWSQQEDYHLWSPRINVAFANHIRETYKNKTYSLVSFDVALVQASSNKYTDSAFHLNYSRLGPGSQNSLVNYNNLNYEEAINILSDQQHLLIPNSYLLGQLAEDKKRFFLESATETNTVYGNLLTAGDNALKLASPDNGHAYARNFDENIGLEQHMQLWTRIVNPGINKSISVPGLDSSKIFGFPKYKFLQEYRLGDQAYPWRANITINVPAAQPGDQFLKKIFNSEGEGGDPDPSQDQLMLFLMAFAAGNELVTPTEENYWKREMYSKEIIDTFSWDLTQFVGAWSLEEFAVESNNLISFDFGSENTGWHNIDSYSGGIASSTRNAFAEVTDKLKKFTNTRSAYEILNAPLYDGKQMKTSPGVTICQPPGRSRCASREEYGVHYNMSPFTHTEIMFYEIEKSKHDQIVQRFFIAAPTTNEETSIEYFDSQIKLNEGYDYTIYTYIITVGNEYQYQDIRPEVLNIIEDETFEGLIISGVKFGEDVKSQRIDVELADSNQKRPPVATIYTINKPKIKLLKIPYIKFPTLYTADAPPLHPNVEIFPYQNINNKLLFLVSQYVGESEDIPIPILPGDEELFNKAKLAQNASSKIIFKSDEPDYTYQIFRLEKHPIDWSDFSTALRKELPPDKKDFIDNVIPNQKYYYMFRSTDRHGYVSNPSSIFEVELIDDSGAVYLSNKIVDFVEKIPRESTKSIRKYIHIVPTIKQSNLSAPEANSIYVAEGVPQDITLGPVFGRPKARKFKVRFTSKSSGKMFDLNLHFIHTHEGLSNDLKPTAPSD